MSAFSAGVGIRIGDAEREAAVTALGEHFAAGRLTHDELDERMDKAWAARTAADLDPLFSDLPRPEPGPASTARRRERPVVGQPVGFDRRAPRRTGRGRPPIPVLVLLGLFLVAVLHVPVLLVVLGFLLLSVVVKRGCGSAHLRGARGPSSHWG